MQPRPRIHSLASSGRVLLFTCALVSILLLVFPHFCECMSLRVSMHLPLFEVPPAVMNQGVVAAQSPDCFISTLPLSGEHFTTFNGIAAHIFVITSLVACFPSGELVTFARALEPKEEPKAIVYTTRTVVRVFSVLDR